MTLPRRIVPGMTVMVTRRTQGRTHLLRPDPAIRKLFTYCLAVAAERHRIAVHAAVLMSTHEHLIVTDVAGSLPRFLHELHRLMALGVKALRSWPGSVWDGRKTSVVELRTPQAIVEKLAYVMANPVSAGLVRRASQWRGVMTLPAQIGRARWQASRPSQFFSSRSRRWPPSATLQLTVPPALDLTEEETCAVVARELEQLEREARTRALREGRTVRPRGRRAGHESAYRRATTAEERGTLNPVFAVGRGQAAALIEARTLLKTFWNAHRAAMARWRSGDRSALFPHGTWLMHCLHGATRATA